MLLHGGNIDGARVQMTLVPDARLGIALLSNLEGHFGNMAMTNQIVDRYLGTETRDWQTLFLDVDRGEIEAERKRGRDLRAEQRPGTKPPLPLDAYAGDYVDPAYGTCRIRVAEGSLTIAWGDLRSPLEHVAHQRFLATEPPCHDAPFEFRLEGGAVVGVRAFERDFGRK